jgi:hypothetical protein
MGLGNPANYMGGRYESLFSHPNHFAAVTSLPVVTAMAFLTARRQTGAIKAISLGVISSGIALIVLSDSRGAEISCGFGVLVVLLLGLKRRQVARVLFRLCLLAVPMLLLLTAARTRAAMETTHRAFDVGDRTEIWSRQLASFSTSPWIGHGLQFGDGRAGGEGSYTDLLSIAGLFGALPFTFACLLSLHNIRRGFRGVPDDYKLYYRAGAGCLVSVLIVSVGEGWLAVVGGVPPIVAWICLGAFDAAALTLKRRAATPKGPHLPLHRWYRSDRTAAGNIESEPRPRTDGFGAVANNPA